MANKMMTEKEFMKVVNKAIKEFVGDSTELERAIGMLALGRQFGWKPLMLIHDKRTIRKYEEMLSIYVKEVLPEVGKHAERSFAWKVVLKVGGFWNAVKGLKKGIRSPKME